MKTYTCVRCGKQFQANHRTAACADCHTAVCVICGKTFDLQPPWTQQTCSRECRGKYVKETGIAKARTEKAHKTIQAKGFKDLRELQQSKSYEKICAYCRKPFTTHNPRQVYCLEPHYGPCPVCGELTEIHDMSIGPQACSEACRLKRISNTCEDRYGNGCFLASDTGKQKSAETCREKYGVDHYSKTQEFHEKFVQTLLDHYGVSNPRKDPEINQKAINTCIEKYGGASPTCHPDVMNKARDTALKNHGGFGMASPDISKQIVETKMQRYGGVFCDSKILSEKIANTNLSRYGVKNPLQSKEIRARGRKTSLDRYGTEYPSQSDVVKQKVAQTNLSKYGVSNVFASPQIQAYIKKTMLERYGVDNPQKSEVFRQKSRETCRIKYGSDWYNSSKVRLSRTMIDPTKVEVFSEFSKSPASFIQSHYTSAPTLTEIARDTGVDIATISNYISTNNLQHMLVYRQSTMERDVVAAVKQLLPDARVELHNRSVITPYELDVYLPDYNLGVECNPTVTHNSTIGDPWSGAITDYKYHQMKSILANQQGAQLFHIFGYEWNHRRDIVISMLASLLHVTKHRFYARNCYVAEIPHNVCKDFLDANHRQGSTHASIRLGLFTSSDNTLVSVMTFNRIRKTLGKSFGENTWELSRFCSLLYSSVVGGASKLLAYFKKHYTCKKLISYSDVAHTRGDLYSKLGFYSTSVSSPGYVWVDYQTDQYINRVSCQKSNLRRLFHDDSIDIANKTEREIMEEHGYVRVYDSGVIRWELDL